MTPSLASLLEPIRHSPRLVEAVDLLERQVREERERRRRFYEEMTPDQKVEFIDGEVILHSPARNVHLDVTRNIALLLSAYAQSRQLGEVKIEKCLCAFPRNDYEPDVVFFGKDKAAKFQDNTMKFPPPDLVVEVLSESTQARDRGVKFEDFQAHGVREYWIVDADQTFVEQYVLRDAGYELAMKSSSGEVRSEAIPGFVTLVRAFFSSEENSAALRGLV